MLPCDANETSVEAEPRGVTDCRVDGINVAGYLRTESGMGSTVRAFVRALRRLDIPLSLTDLSPLSGNRAEDRTLAATDSHPFPINLICPEVELHFPAMALLGENFFRGRHTIGVWFWELPAFPERWYDRFVYYDEIWVGSSFIADALAPVAPVPVVRMTQVLSAETAGSREEGRRRLGAAPGEFVFLFIFDFHSRFERKNPLAVIDAFRRAFRASEPVRLVIKCVNSGFDRENFATMSDRARGYPISIHDGYWTAQEMRDLMAACDAYVALHRSEGLGLPIGDAMALGKPVIATGWSGNMEFMNVANSFPVRYELVAIQKDVGLFQAGQTWAEPSVEHAAELMRLVRDDPAVAACRGRAAQREIETRFSDDAVAFRIRQRLAVLESRHRLTALKRDLSLAPADVDGFLLKYQDINRYVPAHHLRYQKLLNQVRDAVRSVIPAGATVLVISKGEPEIVNLEGRRAWHFPRTDDGAFAGHHPADSQAAIDHLETLHAKGAQYLLIPATAFWWLEHYEALKRYLDEHYSRPVWRDNACIILDLCRSGRS